MLKVKVPTTCSEELRYTISVVFTELLVTDYLLETHEDSTISMAFTGSEKNLQINNDFFSKAQHCWLEKDSLPTLPLAHWDVSKEGFSPKLLDAKLPVIFGEPEIQRVSEGNVLKLDVFGSIFFMLSRYEEAVEQERDEFDRFPAKASVAFKENFLNRPIVDEYLAILEHCITALWPDISLQKPEYKKFITCDTDWPFEPTRRSFKKMTRSSARSVLVEKNVKKALNTIFGYIKNCFGLEQADPHRDAVNWIMEENEKVGNKVAFYFITVNTSHLDNNDDFDSDSVRSMFNEIHSRGHEIGVHPGFETYANASLVKQTVDKLKQIFQEEGITQKVIGGRQHYLKWDVTKTPRFWDENGLQYDSTLMYAEMAGFRCGTCREYSMYDIIRRKPLKLKQRPLLTMESTIIAERYEGYGYGEKSLQRFLYFKDICKQFGGTYTLLWHNCHLLTTDDRILYKELIS
ncbi:hypothetical protein XMA121_000131 [Marinobacterium sp. xm-a-121]|uniref:polysaccharide deacetylase family protein n=1 Tax=unclassified Marinobacterium TaxID=2644139 RepID=UPI0015692D9A|nr:MULTISPECIES: polysaccharide deacetylase family protein [unclassified Marinobacterium]NRP37546.1 hypothetical protein [Marinobacterium sp. xm-a-121]NRP99890.1 hypothetical protein [Marinobacterium sp. xm-v-233]